MLYLSQVYSKVIQLYIHMYLFFFSKMFPFRLLQNIEQNFSGGSVVKNLPAMQEMQVQSLGQEDPLEKCMATHSSILAWRIPWIEGPGGLQSIGLQSPTQLKWLSMHLHWAEFPVLYSRSLLGIYFILFLINLFILIGG